MADYIISGSAVSTGSFAKVEVSQKIGIGLTNPTSPLHIRTSTNENFEIEETGGNLRISALNDARSTNVELQFAASEFHFLTGNVGMGITTPVGRLHLKSKGSAPSGSIAIQHSGNTVNIVEIGQSDNGNSGGAIILDKNNGIKSVHIDAHGKSFFNGGNVGFGTELDPDTTIHLRETNDVYLTLESQNTGATAEAAIKYQNYSTGNNFWWVGLNQSDDFSIAYGTIFNAANTRFNILDTGLVGIGTNAPIRALDIVVASGDPGIRLESAAQSMDVITLRNADGRVGFGGDAITVNNSKVGIGTATPESLAGSSLHIRQSSTDTSINLDDKGHYHLVLQNNDGASQNTGRHVGIFMQINSNSQAADASIYTEFEENGGAKLHFTTTKSGTGQERMVIDSDGSVGIGTLVPSNYHPDADNLVLYGSGNSGMTIASGTSSHGNIWFADATGGVGEYQSRIQFNHNDNTLMFAIGGTEIMRFLSSGNVGFGTASPAVLLHLSSSSANQFRIERSGTTNAAAHFKNAADDWYAGITSQQDFSISQNADIASGTEFRIQDSTGNVGIGTTSPADQLVVDTSNANGVGGFIRVSNKIGGAGSTVGINFATFSPEHHTTTSSDTTAQIRAIDVGSFAGRLDIRVRGLNSNGVFANVASFTNNAKVGIGTTSPDTNLHIFKASAGSVTANANAVLTLEDDGTNVLQFLSPSDQQQQIRFGDTSDDGAGILSYNHSTNAMQFATAGPIKMTLDSSGRLGINKTSPTDTLHVAGGITMEAANAILAMNVTNTTGACQIRFGDTGDNDIGKIVYGHNTNAMSFNTADAERLRIDSSGNVGIGTESPSAKLHVIGDTIITGNLTAKQLIVSSSVTNMTVAQASGSTIFGDTVSTDTHQFSGSLNVTGSITLNGSSVTSGGGGGGGISFNGSTADGLVTFGNSTTADVESALTFNGNTLQTTVAGDATIKARSSVNSSGNDAIVEVNVAGTSAGDPFMRYNIDNVGAWLVGVDNSDSDKFKIAGLSTALGTNDRLVIDTSGNVGIGTSSPGKKFVVETTTDFDGILVRDTNDVVRLFNGGGNDGYIQLLHGNAVKNQIHSNGITYLNGGNVGIGTTSPNGLLELYGGTPALYFYESDAGAGDRLWNIAAAGETFAMNCRNDANSSGNTFFAVERTDSNIDSIKLKTGAGVDAIHIDSSQRVGINNTSPQLKLDVSNGASGIAAHFGGRISTSNGTIGGISFGYYESNNANYRKAGIIQEQIGDSHARGDLHLIVNTQGGQLSATAADARLTIDGLTGDVLFPVANQKISGSATSTGSFGRVGIGTGSPTETLHLYSSDNVEPTLKLESATTGNQGAQLEFVNSGTDADDNDIVGTIRFKGMNDADEETEYCTIYNRSIDVSNGSEDSEMHFRTITAGTLATTMLLQSGKVGIGLSAPTSPFHLRNGKTSSIPNLLVDDSTGHNAILEVTSLSNSADAFIIIGSQTNRDTSLRFNENGSVSFQIKNDTSADSLAIKNASGTDLMTLLQTGNVGIGTTTPGAKLEVNGGDVSTSLVIRAGGSTGGIRFYDSGGTTDGYIQAGDGYIGFLDMDGHWGVRHVSNSKTEFRVNNSVIANITANGMDITGKLTATSKSFLINHPTKENKKLQYASLEGPENGVYVRGKFQGGKYQDNIIDLPDYWVGLVDEDTITINLTPVGKYQQLYVEDIKDNQVFIKSADDSEIKCFYTIYGERKDIEKLEVEF